MEEKKRYALISTWDKTGVESLARALLSQGYLLLATGGTHRSLKEASLPCTEVSELSGEAERFDGRLKTLHHKILGGILYRPGQDDEQWPYDFRIPVVVCNFYPFREKAAESQSLEEATEWVDIGGPNMLRAAAKNFKHVYALTHPGQYTRYIAVPDSEREALRKRLAFEAFMHVRDLDEEIVHGLADWHYKNSPFELRYGENPEQPANFVPNDKAGLACFGTLSFNNVRDAESAYRYLRAFDPNSQLAAAVIKHQGLCGAAASRLKSDEAKAEVFRLAWEGDTTSRFGGVLAFNFTPTATMTEELHKRFVELIVLTKSEESQTWAKDFFQKKARTRIVLVDHEQLSSDLGYESFGGALGRLRQLPDRFSIAADAGPAEFFEQFAEWTSACAKSNSISLCGETAGAYVYLAGMGQGQPNRVEALKLLALPRALDYCKRMDFDATKLLCASDAFLPFPDLVQILAESGIKKLLQPGGSKADAEVSAEAQRLDVQMSMSGRRHFWH